MGRLKAIDKYILVLSLSIAVTLIVLSLLAEKRIDVYIALYILEYFTITAIFSPFPRKLESKLNIISAIMLATFIAIVAYRVMLIISPSLILGGT